MSGVPETPNLTRNRLKAAAGIGALGLALAVNAAIVQKLGGIDAVIALAQSLWQGQLSAKALPPPRPLPPPIAKGSHSLPSQQSEEEARSWLGKAQKGDSYAQFRAGIIYEYGLDGVVKNAPEAVRYYKLSSD